ncbi:MAG: serine/threonine protein kinase [Prevotella sp.]|nr:serine/threonine protein kinase [Prevotella sp.]
MIEQRTMLPIGTILHGTYRVEEYLSSGGFGNTYVVTNVQFDEAYAMKEFFMKGVSQREGQTTVSVSNADNQQQFEAQREKFKKEARRLRKLQNSHIVHVHDLFEENGTAYYVMDLLDGESLSARMKRLKRPLTEQEVRAVLPQVLGALKEVHAQQIWHLDLKPGNIMTDHQGRAVLIDFGASKQMDASQGYTGTSTALCYTPGYAPSEQIDGNIKRIGPWTDFYALGATLYNLLSNQQPPSTSDVMMEGADAFQFPASVSSEMQQLVVWLMNARPASRPQSVEEIEQQLNLGQPAAGPESAVAEEPALPEEPAAAEEEETVGGEDEEPVYVEDESAYKYTEPGEYVDEEEEEEGKAWREKMTNSNNTAVQIIAVVALGLILMMLIRAVMEFLLG